MDWGEFCTLLKGIMYKTPLGQVVSIRSEEDKDILKNFTKEQNRIRSEWRNRVRKKVADNMTEAEKVKSMKQLQEMMKQMFGTPK